MKLNPDDRDDLETILLSDGWDIFLKVAEEMTADQEKRVLQYDLGAGPEGLVHVKARSEGARKLMHSIQQLKKDLLSKNKNKASKEQP